MTTRRVLSGGGKWLLQFAAAGLVVACGADPAAAPGSEPARSGETDTAAGTLPDGTHTDDGTLFPDASSAELLGGQSGVEGGCVPLYGTQIIEDAALDQVIEGIGYRPMDLLAYVAGVHSATVRWGTVDPPGGAATDGETLQLEVVYVGPTKAYVSSCGHLLKLPVAFHVRSESGALDLEGEGTLQTGRTGDLDDGVGLGVDYPLDALGDWAAQVTPVLNLRDQSRFSLNFWITPAGMTGAFQLISLGKCHLAQWPVDSECNVGVDDPEHGARISELFQRIEGMIVPKAQWADGTPTSLTFAVASSPRKACVAPRRNSFGPPPPGTAYRAPLELHVSTGDGRVDVTLPAQIGGLTNAEGQWSRLAFSTSGNLAAPPDRFGHLDFEAIGATDRAVVSLDGDSASGFLAIASLAPRSLTLREIINPACVSDQPMDEGRAGAGQITKVTSLSWRPIQPVSTPPKY